MTGTEDVPYENTSDDNDNDKMPNKYANDYETQIDGI